MTLPFCYILYQPKLSVVGFQFQISIERRSKIVFSKSCQPLRMSNEQPAIKLVQLHHL
jgi:hypothetical protein